MRRMLLATVPILMVAVAPTSSRRIALAQRSVPGPALWPPGRLVP